MEASHTVCILLLVVSFSASSYSQSPVCPSLCEPNPCQHGGTCTSDDGCFLCACPPDYTGDLCEIDTCNPECENGGTCSGGICECPEGFTGWSCETATCNPECENGGTCVDGVCICPEGFYGDTCEIEGCDPECVNGGTCVDGECECPDGFEGEACEIVICNPDCQNGGTCKDGKCECPLGYTGSVCETRSDDCDPACQNGGTCFQGVCVCPIGYTGDYCETDMCDPPCENGGICWELECLCPPTYTGRNCSDEIQPGQGWNCDTNNPCNVLNVLAGRLRWPYEANCTQFVLCVAGPPIDCHIMNCAVPTVWNPFEDTCTDPSNDWPCYPDTAVPGSHSKQARKEKRARQLSHVKQHRRPQGLRGRA